MGHNSGRCRLRLISALRDSVGLRPTRGAAFEGGEGRARPRDDERKREEKRGHKEKGRTDEREQEEEDKRTQAAVAA